MADRLSKVVYPKVIGHSCLFLLNKFFVQSIPSIRNVDDGEKQEKKTRKEKNGPLTSLPVNRLNGDRLQRRPLVPKFQL